MAIKGLYLLKKKDIRAAAEILTVAFHNDPLIQLIYPDDTERRKNSFFLWKFLLNYGVNVGEVYAPSSQLEGICIWFPPKKEHINIYRAIRYGAVLSGLKMHFQKDARKLPLKRIIQITDVVARIHKEVLNEPHWYLSSIAVNPKHQGKGFASKLIRPMLERAQRENYPIYLETSKEENVSLYEHLGFELVNEIKLPTVDVKNWSMLKR
ncbi:MAG: GNAT family N-acetyltransferase [Candidatus Heimdallarchaeaceae archaeon]